MKKFKDFLYDKNDIIIALLILVAASLLIIWRMNAIMEYPKSLISDTESTSTQQDSGDDDSQTADPSTEESGDQGSGDSGTEEEQSSASTSAVWSNGVLSTDVEVTVSGASASEAVECLVAAGLFTDYADYQATCTNLGLDHQKVSAGTFTFAGGSSKDDVAKAVNWG